MPEINHLAAALFLITAPMIIVAIIIEVGFEIMGTGALFEISLALGIAVLGYQLWLDTVLHESRVASAMAQSE